ncbi:MAG: hypothetical protein CSA72_01940 [Rhodobacterales bacterium]|nr:MAG: hypothetical protein CSA72_01940 [Rhodobacterales bacterium]
MTSLTLKASPARRFLALTLIAGLALILLTLALRGELTGLSRLVLGGFGLAALAGAEAMRRATMGSVTLTETGLVDESGRLIAALDDIESVDRGAFAFKPSNGFILRTRTRGARHWAPGLWWRMGRRVGIGGVTPAAPAKSMAEEIGMHIAQRNR